MTTADDLALLEDTSDDSELEQVGKARKDEKARERCFLQTTHRFNGQDLPDFGAVGIWMYWELNRLPGVKSSVAEAFVVLFLLTENFKDWEFELDADVNRRKQPRLAQLVSELVSLGSPIFFQRHVLPWAVANIVAYELIDEAQEVTDQITKDLFRVKAKARGAGGKDKPSEDESGN